MGQLIYICDTNHQIANIFKGKLSRSGSRIDTFSNFEDLSFHLNKNLPDLILLSPRIFADTRPSEEFFVNITTIVYAEEMEVEEKLNYYRLGVNRVVVERMALVSTVISICNMVLDRHSNFRKIRQQTLNYGKLHGYSLQEIFQNAFLEKKNLIIKVQNNGWNAKIRLFQGHIVYATASDLKNEEAVLKTLHLPIGKFTIRRFRKREEHSSVISSTPAILAELKFEQGKMQEFFEKIGSNNPIFEFSSLKNRLSLEKDEKTVMELVKEYSEFQKIQLNSPFPVLKTVKILSQLFDEKLIYHEGEGETIETFLETDIQYITENIFPTGVDEGRIVILGIPSSGKSELIRRIAGHQQVKIQSVQYLDFTRIQLKKNTNLTIFGISIDENFQPIFDKISEGMLAYIFLVDVLKKESFEYTKYLLSKMLQTYKVPCVLGLTNMESNGNQTIDSIRKELEIPEEIAVLTINPNSFKDVRRLIYNLRKMSPEEENINA